MAILICPVRHHSPAAALQVARLIRERRPRAVLVEGPADGTDLIPLLLDGETAPPVALYAYRATLARGSLSGSHESADTADWLAQEDCARFVAETLPSELSRTDCAVEAGFPETLLNQYATDNGIDLMSVGTQSRNPLLDIFIGSTCRALILSSPCDLRLSGEEQ